VIEMKRQEQMRRESRSAWRFTIAVAVLYPLLLIAGTSFAGISVSERAAIIGNFGVDVESEGTGEAYSIYHTSPSGYPQLQAGFLFDNAYTELDVGNWIRVFSFADSEGVDVASFEFRSDASGEFYWRGCTLVIGGEVCTSEELVDIQNGGNGVSLQWGQSVAGEGFLRVAAFNRVVPDLEFLDNPFEVRTIRLGAVAGTVGMPAESWYAIDDIAIFSSDGPVGVFVWFLASAYDREDGLVSDDIQWTSDIDGPLGSGGGPFMTLLSAAQHEISACVTDSAGQTGCDIIGRIFVEIVDQVPHVTVFEPVALTHYEEQP
jgi:hypothetical protein